jgi:hypothetical protein
VANLDWSSRILEFPVRTAAVDSFLKDLKAKNAADLNAVLVTLNDGSLCREAVGHWVLSGWIAVAPHSPLTAMTGPLFRRDLTLNEFCGRVPESLPEPPLPEEEPPFDTADAES